MMYFQAQWREEQEVNSWPNKRGSIPPSAGLFNHICCSFPPVVFSLCPLWWRCSWCICVRLSLSHACQSSLEQDAKLNLRKVCHSVDEVINVDLVAFLIFGQGSFPCFMPVKTEWNSKKDQVSTTLGKTETYDLNRQMQLNISVVSRHYNCEPQKTSLNKEAQCDPGPNTPTLGGPGAKLSSGPRSRWANLKSKSNKHGFGSLQMNFLQHTAHNV